MYLVQKTQTTSHIDEKVLRSTPCVNRELAESLRDAWKKEPAVRAGRARVRIITMPDPAKAVNR